MREEPKWERRYAIMGGCLAWALVRTSPSSPRTSRSTRQTTLAAGCGPGLYSEELLARGAEVAAFDHSPKMVELARRRLGERFPPARSLLGLKAAPCVEGLVDENASVEKTVVVGFDFETANPNG